MAHVRLLVQYLYEINSWLIISAGEAMNLQNVHKDSIQIDGRSFPAAVVIKYQDITIQKEIGEGNFGKVYQGHINLNEVQR